MTGWTGRFWRKRREASLEAELKDHFERLVRDYRARGLSETAARHRARLEFGGHEQTKEECRDVGRFRWLEDASRDARIASRIFRRTPGFTIVCVITLALGIGACAAIFSVVNGVVLKPLPYANPDRLVAIWYHHSKQGSRLTPISPANFLDLRKNAKSLARVEAFQANIVPTSISVAGATVPVQRVSVTPGLLTLLDRKPLLGRLFRNDEEEGAIVLSHSFWQREFGGDTQVVGLQVEQGGELLTVVGIMPPDFTFPYSGMLLGPISFTRSPEVDAWVPLAGSRAAGHLSRSSRSLGVVGRLAEKATQDEAEIEMSLLARQLELAYPEVNDGWEARVVGLHQQTVGRVRPALMLLLVAVGLVLLIACVNVASMVLAKSMGRQREMALRAALGAGRFRLIRQTLIESLMLTLAGTAAAALIMGWATSAFVALAPGDIPRLREIAPDWRLAAFMTICALVTALLIGFLPALTAAGPAQKGRLQDAARGNSRGRGRLRAVMVTVEIGLALVLSLAAGLLARSFVSVLNVDPGFGYESILTFQMNVPGQYDTPELRRSFYQQFFEKLEAIPGVAQVGGTTRLPLNGTNSMTSAAVEGRETDEGAPLEVDLRRALGDYFLTMQIPILEGRSFQPTDGPQAPAVIVVNETLSRQFFPSGGALGKRLLLGANSGIPEATIIGIAGDIRHQGLEIDPAPELYIHYLQNPPRAPLIVVRSSGPAQALIPQVREVAESIDPNFVPYDLRTMSDIRNEAVSPRRFLTLLVVAFGVLAQVLAAIGVYGVMSLVCTERLREIGIRLALGALPTRILALVVARGALLAVLGVILGIALSLFVLPSMASQLYGVTITDPMTAVGVPALLLSIALLASAIPALRAVRVSPVQALRYD